MRCCITFIVKIVEVKSYRSCTLKGSVILNFAQTSWIILRSIYDTKNIIFTYPAVINGALMSNNMWFLTYVAYIWPDLTWNISALFTVHIHIYLGILHYVDFIKHIFKLQWLWYCGDTKYMFLKRTLHHHTSLLLIHHFKSYKILDFCN